MITGEYQKVTKEKYVYTTEDVSSWPPASILLLFDTKTIPEDE